MRNGAIGTDVAKAENSVWCCESTRALLAFGINQNSEQLKEIPHLGFPYTHNSTIIFYLRDEIY